MGPKKRTSLTKRKGTGNYLVKLQAKTAKSDKDFDEAIGSELEIEEIKAPKSLSGRSGISKSDKAMIVALKDQVQRYRQLARVAGSNHREQLAVKDQQIADLLAKNNSLKEDLIRFMEISNKERMALINTL